MFLPVYVEEDVPNVLLYTIGAVKANEVMIFKTEQPEKQDFPKLVIPEGSSMEVREEQFSKQDSPKLVITEGSSIEVRARQS